MSNWSPSPDFVKVFTAFRSSSPLEMSFPSKLISKSVVLKLFLPLELSKSSSCWFPRVNKQFSVHLVLISLTSARRTPKLMFSWLVELPIFETPPRTNPSTCNPAMTIMLRGVMGKSPELGRLLVLESEFMSMTSWFKL